MRPTKERNFRMSGTDEGESITRRISWGLCPQTSGIYRIDAIPVNVVRGRGPMIAEPQPGLGPGVGAQFAAQQRSR